MIFVLFAYELYDWFVVELYDVWGGWFLWVFVYEWYVFVGEVGYRVRYVDAVDVWVFVYVVDLSVYWYVVLDYWVFAVEFD